MRTEHSQALLAKALLRLARWQRQAVDPLALSEAVERAQAYEMSAPRQIAVLTTHLRLAPARHIQRPDPAVLPLLMCDDRGDLPVWCVLCAQNSKGQWIAERWIDAQQQWCEEVVDLTVQGQYFAKLNLNPSYSVSQSPTARLVLDELASSKRVLVEAALSGLLITLISMLVALYTMQVYDRVIPTSATQTLMVLTLGVLMGIGFEFLARRVRSHLYDHLIQSIDSQLTRAVYLRFLAVRLDQLPQHVGTLAGQLRGFETVRAFLIQIVTQFLIDAPFALIFAVVMAVIAGPLATIPLIFLVVSIAAGLWHQGQILSLAQTSQTLANQKTGILVETVEGAEIIKSTQGGWRMLGRWLGSNDQARDNELALRRISERAQHLALSLQQLAYVCVIAVGALMVADGRLGFGALVACSIISGRILSPVSQLAIQLVQWGQAKAALRGLDALWKLEGDHSQIDIPVLPDRYSGHYHAQSLRFGLHGKPILDLDSLHIRAGEKIAVLGPIGAGKTTLLRVLSGMYLPQQGRVLLDDVDLAHIAKPWLAEQVGYLPQDGRLIEGTLRGNLTLGLNDPGDSALMEAATQTGLLEAVVKVHPLGLSQPVHEGGLGLSGGQRQLVNLTRIFLRSPMLWLLDEPTASLDRHSEVLVIQALKRRLSAEHGLVLVTHKPEMLQLVDRIVLVAHGRVVMDGPKNEVLSRLQQTSATIS